MQEKSCFIQYDGEYHIFYSNKFIRVDLMRDDDEQLMCILTGPGNWELSYTGALAEEKFERLLTLGRPVTFNDFSSLGFTQYG